MMIMAHRSGRRALAIAAFTLFVGVAAASAQPAIDIEKYTNGQDADAAPGPAVIVGSTVNWTYVVTNTGSRPLTNISVTDDQGVTVTCPGTTLGAGLSFTCTGSGTAVIGQYANIGSVTATLPDATVATDSDPSHYFGQSAPAVAIEKRTEGVDADTPPGPSLPAGSTVNWTYEITNLTAGETLIDIVVTDDHGVVVSCPGVTLAPGASMTCTGSGTVQPGQYSNIGSVTATTSPGGENVAATDPSHYFGQTLLMVKRTNGIESNAPPGPTLVPGAPVTWTYEVTNPGPASVSGLTVTDDQGVVVSCPQATLASGETTTCSASGTVQAGQYTNVGTATATLPAGGTVTASDAGYYFGNPIDLEKATNGVDADVPPGPAVAVGSTVNWTYLVTNNGVDTLTGIAVTDDQGVTVTCGSTSLAAGASMTCTASGLATSGQYSNVGTVDATSATYGAVSASDASHYFGQSESLDFGDTPDPAFLTLFASNGARHVLGGGVYLGACVDAEVDALAGAGAAGDDADTGSAFGTCAVPGDDEDGVTFAAPLVSSTTGSVTVVASAPCTLSAWIDFEADGDWADAGETLFPGGTALAAGANPLAFPVPASAVAGTTYARFRCTTDGEVGVVGQAGDGEVEDYEVSIVPPSPSISATKVASIVVDVDGDTVADPGDTLLYTVTIANSGTGPATAVVFTDTPDANTSLVVGSVASSAGVVTSGNTAGDTSVAVNVGAIAVSASVTITFQASINSPLPPGVTSVANQGSASGGNFSSVPTDDPAVGGASNPTVTQVVVTPVVTASKDDVLLIDVDGDGVAEPGDSVRYTVTIANNGNGAATAVVFSDTPDPNTALVVGSVTTTAGSVTSGNTAGDTAVGVNAGTIAAGATVTITFDVTITSPFPSGVSQISNTGSVSGSNISTVSTDDPAFPGSSDPTITPVTAAPIVTATKTAALVSDPNGNGIAEEGDRLRYTITVSNSGTTAALGVQFNDTPDPNTTIVPGSVTASAGLITSGNAPGDTTVTVDIGTLSVAAVVTITFDVAINEVPDGVTSVTNSGTVSGSNFSSIVTDSPSAPGSADPTIFAVAAPAAAIPTLDTWALLAISLLLAIVALRKLAWI